MINLALAALYLGLWIWAKRHALAATGVALMLFVTAVVAAAAFSGRIDSPSSAAGPYISALALLLAMAACVRASALRERA